MSIVKTDESIKPIKAPFPWFGGKSRVAGIVWERFGDVKNYVEPFAGSLAVLLGRPHDPGIETVNDLDPMICNFWRATTLYPEQTAQWADHPVNESDLHARHVWLRGVLSDGKFRSRIEADPEYCDPKVAGWWVWGICNWIGTGWCGDSGIGPWVVDRDEDGFAALMKSGGRGVIRKLPHLGDAGVGVQRRLPHLGDAGKGVSRNIGLLGWFSDLRERLQRVRVCCGDWTRVLGPSVTYKHGMTGVFLDPPYNLDIRHDGCYAEDERGIADSVREWAIANGDNPLLRIALCSYEGEHTMPDDWRCVAWKANGGMSNQGNNRGRENAHKERIWFSPACLTPDAAECGGLFDANS